MTLARWRRLTALGGQLGLAADVNNSNASAWAGERGRGDRPGDMFMPPVRSDTVSPYVPRTNCTSPPSLRMTNSTSDKDLVELMQSRKPFTFIRLGDGEFICAMNSSGVTNVDKAPLKGAICDRLKQDLQDYGKRTGPNFYVVVGVFFLCKETFPKLFGQVESFIQTHPMQPNWGFINSTESGFYFPLVPQPDPSRTRAPGVLPILEGRNVVLVAPHHLGQLRPMLNFSKHIQVPISKDAAGHKKKPGTTDRAPDQLQLK